MKRCSTCKEFKLYTEFSKNRAHKDGYHNSCKKCTAISDKKVRNKRKLLSNQSHPEFSLEEEKQILFGIKLKEEWAYNKLYLHMRGLLIWRAYKYIHAIDPLEMENMLNFLHDKMLQRIHKLSKKPERRQVSKHTGRPNLKWYLSICAHYDCLTFITQLSNRKWYERHERVDRHKYPLTELQRYEIAKMFEDGKSVYYIARRFSLNTKTVYKFHWKYFRPEKYAKDKERIRAKDRRRYIKKKALRIYLYGIE